MAVAPVLQLHRCLGLITRTVALSWSDIQLHGRSEARHVEVSQSKLVSYLSLFTCHDSSSTEIDTVTGLQGNKHISVVFCNNRNVKKSFRKNSIREFEPKMSVYSAVLSAPHAIDIVSHYYYNFFAGNCLCDGYIRIH